MWAARDFLGVLLSMLLMLIPAPASARLAPPDLTAKSAILIEASTGKVLFARNAEEKRPPASTTKIMTLIVALERGNLDDIVTTSERAYGTEGSTLWLDLGEKMKMEDMLYGMMMISGNDATVAVAEHIAGSVENFAQLMNEKARVIGTTRTHFTNPSGLPDPDHYSSAHDLARIAAYGYRIPKFVEIVTTEHKVIPWPGKPYDRDLYNENKLLWMYEGGNGVKTGYTDEAGRCLVAAAKRDGVQLIAVVLDSDYMWRESMALLDYGFSRVRPLTLAKTGDIVRTVWVRDGTTNSLPIASAGELKVGATPEELTRFKTVVELDRSLSAPVSKGQKVGRLKAYYDNSEIAAVDLVATADVQKRSLFGKIWGSLWHILTFMIRNFA